MLAGRALFGGGALLVEQRFGMTFVLVALVCVTWGSLGLVLLSLGDDEPARGPGAPRPALLPTLRQALLTRASLLGLGFALLSGAGFEAVGAVAGALLVDRGIGQEAVGYFFAVPTVLAMVAGSVLGGFAADRFARIATVRAALLALSAAVLVLALFDGLGVGGAPLLVALGLVYLGIGTFVAASYSLFMDLTEPRVAATQFSAYMGATNACEAWSGFTVGRMVAPLGYGSSFALLTLVSLGSLALLARLRRPTHG
jgi:predicted MFS family arabinose efflux permease